MAKIKIQNQTVPTTPDTGYTNIYVDSADEKLKIKKDDGNVDVIASEEYVSDSIGDIDLTNSITNTGYSNMPTGTWSRTSTGVTDSFQFTSNGFIIGTGLCRRYSSATSRSLDISSDNSSWSTILTNQAYGNTGYQEQGNGFCVFIPSGNYVRMSLNASGGDGSVALQKYIFIDIA